MLRVYVHLTTGEKLKSFRARKFDIDLGKQREAGVQKYTYTGPEGEEETIYLNPEGVAAIELRHVKESTERGTGGSSKDDRNRPLSGWNPQEGRRRLLLPVEDEQEGDPPRRRSGGRQWPPPQGSEGPDAKIPGSPE